MGSTISIIIRIRNFTPIDITSLYAYDVDPFDFGSTLRPDHLFTDISLPSGRCVEKTIELNSMASNCPFAMKMTFRDGSVDIIKINSKCILGSNDANFRHVQKSHCISYQKTGPRILEIIIKPTQLQLQNIEAEELIKLAKILLSEDKFHEASMKLVEAAQLASENTTKEKIRMTRRELECAKGTEIDNKARAINDEGMQLLKENKYQQAVKKLEEAANIAKNVYTISLIEYNLKTARDAKSNQDAKKLNQEALLLKKDEQIDDALQKFDEALKLALDTSLVTSIRSNKAETLSLEAKTILDSAWLAEEAEDAIYKFAKAKFLYQEADSIRHDPDYQRFFEIIDKKVQGDKKFNIAVQLEREGARLLESSLQSISIKECQLIRKKYEESRTNYKEARKLFEEGLKMGDDRFKKSLQLSNEAINAIEISINDLDIVEIDSSKQ